MLTKTYKFKDLIIKSRTGLNPRKNFKLGTGENYYITIKDIFNDSINFTDKTAKVDDEALKIINKRSDLQIGDVLFSSIGRIGDTAIVKEKPVNWNINESVFAFTVNKDVILPEFLCLLFKVPKYKDELIRQSTGSTFASIKMNKLNLMEFEVPSIKDQEKILNEFNVLFNAKKNKQSQYKLLKSLVSNKFLELFKQRLDKSETKISEIATSLIGLTYKPENVCDSGTLVLRSGNIQDNELSINDDLVFVQNIDIPENKMIRENDILMCSRNGSAQLVGKSCLITNVDSKMTFGAFMTVIRTDFPYFLQSFFESKYFKYQLTSVSTTSVNQITSKMLNNFLTTKPTKDEERNFSTYVNKIDAMKRIVGVQINDIEELINSKYSKYFGI